MGGWRGLYSNIEMQFHRERAFWLLQNNFAVGFLRSRIWY